LKTTGSDLFDGIILNRTKSGNRHSMTRVTYVDDDGQEYNFQDWLPGIKLDKVGDPPEYANIQYGPGAGTLDMKVLNHRGIYSPDQTTSPWRDLFKRDLEVRIYDGKNVGSLLRESSPVNLARPIDLSDGIDYSATELAINQSAENKYRDDYDFGDTAYAVYEFIPKSWGADTFEEISVTANSAAFEVLVQYGGTDGRKTSAGWTDLGDTVNGTATFTLAKKAPSLRVAISWTLGTWGAGDKVTAISVETSSSYRFLRLGTFLLNDPDFKDPKSPSIGSIKLFGQNAWKRAVSVDINLSDLTTESGGGLYIDELLKRIFDFSNIPYSDSDIPDLSSYGLRTLSSGFGKVIKVGEAVNYLLDIIGKDYILRVNDSNQAVVVERVQEFLGDFVLDFRDYINAQKILRSDRAIQRITIQSEEKEVKPEETLASGSVSGNGTLSWNGQAKDKYFEITNQSGDLALDTITFENSSVSYTTTGSGSFTLTIKGSRFKGVLSGVSFSGTGANDMTVKGDYLGDGIHTYKITINTEGTPDTFDWERDGVSQGTNIPIPESSEYSGEGAEYTLELGVKIQFATLDTHNTGDEFSFVASTETPEYLGEAVDISNMTEKNGRTFLLTNPIIISDTEAKERAQDYVDEYGTPLYEIDIDYYGILSFAEQGDSVVIYSKEFNESRIYQIKSLAHEIKSEVDKRSRVLLVDTGIKLSDQGEIVYNRSWGSVAADIPYNRGYVYNSKDPIGIRYDDVDKSQYTKNVGTGGN